MNSVSKAVQHVKYVGPKKSIRISFPVPFVCKSEETNQVEFVQGRPTPLTPDEAKQICNHSAAFYKMCDENGKELK